MTIKNLNKRHSRWILLVVTCFTCISINADTNKKNDTHYNAAGFFDLHVCNWPDRDPFFLAVFSTYRFKELKSVKVYRADGSLLGRLNLFRYRLILKKGKPQKRAFISEFNISAQDKSGWYSASIELKDGSQYQARDLVELETLGKARIVFPGNKKKLAKPPAYLEWDAIPGARFYKVFVRDLWEGGKLILETKLIKSNRYQLPNGLIEPGGWYSWKVHARDVNEDIKFGDFNRGSISAEYRFSVE